MNKLLSLIAALLFTTNVSGKISIIHNGNLTSDDLSSFNSHNCSIGISEGEGPNGSNCFVVTADAMVTNSWDSQFWIVFNEPLHELTEVTVKFDYKSDSNALVETWAQYFPGSYNHHESGIGNIYFTDEWQTLEKTFTITEEQEGEGGRGYKSIAFNLSLDVKHTYYFANFIVEAKNANIGEPSWINVLFNGNCEGEVETGYIGKMSNWDGSNITDGELYSFWCHDNINGEGVNIVDGAGVDGSRGIVVESVDDAVDVWDTQFYITSPHQFVPGQRFYLKFDYRADDYASVTTEFQGLPHGYIYWGGIGDFYFTTEWQTFEKEFVVNKNWCTVTDQYGDIVADWNSGLFFQTIAFTLNVDKSLATKFYFDNIEWSLDNGEGGYATQEEVEYAEIVKNQVQYEGNSIVTEEEWNLLKSIYLSLENTDGWKQKWDFFSDTYKIANLPGVKAEGEHIVSVNLSDNNLTGNFPFALLTLPYLKTLDLSANNLTGDIGAQTTAFMRDNPSASFAVKTINISYNQFAGNLATFANCFADLESLNASSNFLEEIYPMISTKVSMLDISQQSISRTVPLHLADLSVDFLAKELPSIVLYDHNNQTYSTDITLQLSTSDNSWNMLMASQYGQITFHTFSEHYEYHGQSGDILNIKYINNNFSYYYDNYVGDRTGCSFQIALSFDKGDGNFDGQVNVLDLQTILNYMFEEYEYKPFNFTASNLWNDDVINVQDAVCLVNLLLDNDSSASREHSNGRKKNKQSVSAEASVAIENGLLVINSAVPVSSFDIIVSSDKECEVASSLIELGFNCVTKLKGNQTRLIGYSLNGSKLPIGKNVIGKTSKGIVTYAMLSDENACEIPNVINGTATNVQSMKSRAQSTEVYRLSLGAKHAISIDATGKKTMMKEKNNE